MRIFVGDFEITQPRFAFRDELEEQQATKVVEKLTNASSLDVMYGGDEQDEYAQRVVREKYHVHIAGHGRADLMPKEHTYDFFVPEMQDFVRMNAIHILCLAGSNTSLGDLTNFPSVHTIHAGRADNLVWDVGKHKLIEASVSGEANFTQLAHVPSLLELHMWCSKKVPDLSSFQHVKGIELASTKPFTNTAYVNIQQACLHKLTKLTSLCIEGYVFGGQLPSDLGMMTGLKRLTIACTGFTGNIPPEFGNLVNLERLEISTSKVSGSIPLEVLRLERLDRITADKSVTANKMDGWYMLTTKSTLHMSRTIAF